MRLPALLHPTALIWLLFSGCTTADTNPATDGDRSPHGIAEPVAEFPTAFTVIRAIMALPDGRLVVSDAQDNRVSLIDFPGGTSRQLGRIGEGPREFRQVGGLYRAPGGGVFILDQTLHRLLPVLPSGALQDVVWSPTMGAAGFLSPRGPDLLSFDSLGHAYSAIRSGGFTAPTSDLLRYTPGARTDTVTQLRRPLTRELKEESPGVQYQEVLFSPEDAWAVAPDGRIAVVRAVPYRVEWFPLVGPAVTGPTIAYGPVDVTPADKELIASGAGGPPGRISVTVGLFPSGGQSSAQPGKPTPIPVAALLFAKVKPPVSFRDGRHPLLDERGRLWVERSLAVDTRGSVFDVFDRAGNLVDRISLPAGSRLVGFDQSWLYTARIDANDFEHLQRFPLPP